LPAQILWTFSIYLEAVAIMPQLFLLQKTEVRTAPQSTTGCTWELHSVTSAFSNVVVRDGCHLQVTDVLTWHYVFCMGMYRAFYLLNWVWRYMTQEGYSDWIVWVAGIIQTVLYLDFFYYYIKCKLDGKAMALPS
jgi:ER lumen protein retaining receptor